MGRKVDLDMDDITRVTWLKKSPIKHGWLKAILFFICFLSFGFIFHLILTIFGGKIIILVLRVLDLFSGAKWYYREWVTIALTNPISTLFWVWIFHKIINKQSFFSLGFQFSGYKDDFISGVFLGLGIIGLGFGTLYVFNLLSVESIQFSLNNHLLYIFVFFLIAVGEEVSIRGFILKNLSSSFNKYIALVLSSLAYVYIQVNIGMTGVDLNMIAAIGIVSLLNLFLFGILLGLYCIYRNNLWFPIGMNFSWNYLKGPVCNFWNYHPGMNTIFIHNLKASEFENSILLTALIALGIVIVHKRYNSNNRIIM